MLIHADACYQPSRSKVQARSKFGLAWQDGEHCQVQLWRVMHTVVVARERPDLEAQVLEAR